MKIIAISMILGFPRFPLHQRNHETCMEIDTFQWFWASHASTEGIMKMHRNLQFSMILGFPRFPLHRRNHKKCMGINAFSMILGFPRFIFHSYE